VLAAFGEQSVRRRRPSAGSVVLTRNGRAAAIIMNPEDLEALEDTLELLSDPMAIKEIDRARQDVARGKVVTAEELRSKYLRR